DLIDVAQMLSATKTVQFKSGKNLKDGSARFEYTETIDAAGGSVRRDNSMSVPDAFTLGIVPFIGGDGVEITARLRFRIQDQKLTFHYVLNRPHKLVEEAVNVAIQDIESKTSLKVLRGTAQIISPPSL